VGITAGYGVGAHNAFYRAREEGSGHEARKQRRSGSNRRRLGGASMRDGFGNEMGRGVDEKQS
jgi:hypothetical protein